MIKARDDRFSSIASVSFSTPGRKDITFLESFWLYLEPF